jgi:peptidoglycan/LPS O-acetylase OafA/YrhL
MNAEKIMEGLSRFAFATASLVLMALSFALVVYGVVEVASVSISSWKDAGGTILAAIGYVVIAMAVFDLAKYFIEEEVIRGRELREAAEARRSLTKFVSTIAIAVFIEGLVITFQASKDDLPSMLYPTALLLTAILIVVGLGLFQRLSAEVERKLDSAPKKSR